MLRHKLKVLQRCQLDVEWLERRMAPALIASQFQLDPPVMTTSDVQQLLQRAAASTSANDAIIAVVDRGGNLLGVFEEAGVSSLLTSNQEKNGFAIDGAISLARTAAFFSNDTTPLTSRTIQELSESTITQREVQSDPSINDPNSTLAGPGFVAPVGVQGHFPPGVQDTPEVDLFDIEETNRESYLNPGPDGLKGTPDDIPLTNIYNIAQFASPSQAINAPLSYEETLLTPAEQRDYATDPYQSRGIATLPGGIPLYKDGVLVGGIGVFFPGTTGYATAENSSLSSDYNPSLPDLSLEAEFMAFAAEGSKAVGLPAGILGGIGPVPGYDLPAGNIDLGGITLNSVGPGGLQGPANLAQFAQANYGVGTGTGAGTFLPIDNAGDLFITGVPVPEGYIVAPHAGGGLTADDVRTMIEQGIDQANATRAQIRGGGIDGDSAANGDDTTAMTFAVTDSAGDILALYRMPDSTVFSIDVAVAKARNDAYYDDPTQLQPQDQVPGLPAGTALTSRDYRYLAQPDFPTAVDGTPPGPFSILNDPGSSLTTGLNTSAPLPAADFQSVMGYDAFHPDTNFHDPNNLANQNGVVFFPGSSGVYKAGTIVGGLGVSGDGVTQDDFVTSAAVAGYDAPTDIQADQYFVRGVRLPYMNFPRNPEDV